MINKFKKINYYLKNYYLYDIEKALKEILKFYLSNKKTCINYFHINKTGGKYIKNLLNLYLDKDYFKSHEHSVKAKWINPKYKVMISIRDPIDRFISSYYSDLRYSQINNVNPSKYGQLFYQKYPNINSAIKGFINGEKEIGYLTQMGFMSSIRYWGEKKDFERMKNLVVIRTEYLKEDLLNFLTKEFGDFDKWNKIINNFQGDNFKQTNKSDYLLDEEIKKEFKEFLVEEYKLYNYLLTRVYL